MAVVSVQVFAVWQHHIIDLKEQCFPEVLIAWSIRAPVTTAFVARATLEAD